MDKNLPANAGGMGSLPDLGRFHMSQSNWARGSQLLSPCSGALEPQLPSSHAATNEAHAPKACAVPQEKPVQWEARAPQQRVVPAQLEKACEEQWRPSIVKNKDK